MRFLLFALITVYSFATSQVQIVSKTFSADEKSGIAIFSGSAEVTRGVDVIRGDKITVFSTPEREVYRFEVIGSAFFDITTDDNRTFKGSGDELVYLPLEGLYTLKGNAVVEDITEHHKVSGDHIVLNEFTKSTIVEGKESAPVKIIYSIKDKNATKSD